MKRNKLKMTVSVILTFALTMIILGSVAAQEEVADVTVNKFVNQTTVNVGEQFFYVISVNNAGPDPATGVQVTDLLPPTLNFIAATPTQGTYTPGTGLWDIGTILSGNTVFMNIYASPNPSAAGTTVTNTANKTAENEFDPTVPDISSVDIFVPEADVTVTKFTSNPTPNVGELFFYSISVFNGGPDSATGVQVTDMIPAGLNFISATPSQGTYNSGTGLWDIGTINAGVTAFLNLYVIPMASAAGTTITNTATKTAQNEFDPTTPDTSSVDIHVPEADVQLSKTTSNPTPNVGEPFSFTVTATNLGPDDATGVQVTDMIPAGLTFISYTATQGTYNAITGLWDIGTILSGNNAMLTINVEPLLSAANSTITNIATKTAQNEFDPTTPDTASSSVQVPAAADLAITKTANNLNPVVGDLVTFTLTVTNLGPDTGIDVVVNDMLPAGFEFVSSNASIGTYNPLTGVWTIGNMLAGDVETLTIVAEAETAGTFQNTAIVSSDTFDPNLVNNVATLVTVISPAPTPTPTPSVQGQTVPMQPTGGPIIPLLASALTILGGLAIAKRK